MVLALVHVAIGTRSATNWVKIEEGEKTMKERKYDLGENVINKV